MLKQKSIFLQFLLVVCIAVTASATNLVGENHQSYNSKIKISGSRQNFLFNSGWSYLEQGLDSHQEALQSKGWQPVSLPHTWNSLDATDNNPGYRRSTSWYRKELMIPRYKSYVRWIMAFEGVNITCEVYVNGEKAGGHVGGYIGFNIDITEYLKQGKINTIMVKVDNSINPRVIPSQKSDFFIYGGITRDILLQVRPADYIKSLRIATPAVSEESALTTVAIDIIKNTTGINIVSGFAKLLDPSGLEIMRTAVSTRINQGSSTINLELPKLKTPLLWSPSNPRLYSLEVNLDFPGGGDHMSDRFGYRWYEFASGGPFYLNGQRLLLRGTHRHEEWAGLGNALPDSLHRRDIVMIKEIGANFVRLAHYPQDPEIYRACDELGLLVWDELPWCRGGMGGKEWQANTKRLFEEQIRQNFNHPSIIMWSVGNELYWLPDFPDGDNPDSLQAMVNILNDLAHDLDPWRPTAMRKYYDGAEITDIFSPSIWAGWYSGVYKTYEKALEKARVKYPRLFHAEYGGSSHVGRHTETPITGEGLVKEDEWDEKPNMVNIKNVSREGDWSESYIVDLFDWHLMVSEQLDWFPGNAQWAFKDFGTPLRPENSIPYINQKGLVDRAGNPKDAWYVFRSYWTTDPRFCYIESHTWTDRFGPKDLLREVCVYSNCEEVQLSLNGQRLKRLQRDLKDFPASGFHWEILFEEGINELIATGFVNGQSVTADTLKITYYHEKPGKPVSIDLVAEMIENGKYLIHAKVVDVKGILCSDYNKRVYFDCNGTGELVKYQGTPTGSDVIEFASGKAAIEFIPASEGTANIEARTQDFKGDYIQIQGGRVVDQ